MDRLFSVLGQLFLLLLLIFVVISILQSMAESYREFYVSLHTHQWTRTQAKVIRYVVGQYRSGGRDDSTYYRYAFLCAYEVQGQSYTYQMAWHDGFGTWERAEVAGSAACPVGQWVNIFYNPQNPGQVTDSTHWDWASLLKGTVGIPFLMIMSGLLLMGLLSLFGVSPETINSVISPLFIMGWITFAILICIYVLIVIFSGLLQLFKPKT